MKPTYDQLLSLIRRLATSDPDNELQMYIRFREAVALLEEME
jgi:hypothetical protein